MDENLKLYFEKLYDEFSPVVMNIAYSVLNDEELAKDAFQEAFLSIAQNIDHIDQNPEKAKRFIKKVAKNAAVTLYRKYRVIRRTELPLPDAENKDDGNGTRWRPTAFRTESFEEELIKKEDKKNLAGSLNELGDDNFEFVYERYYEDMSYEAIAEKHELSREAAKKRVYRSVDKLKEIFERKEKTNDKTVY